MQEEMKNASHAVSSFDSAASLTYFWMLVLAAWGGVVRVIREHKTEAKTWPQIIGIFVSEMTVSCFVGTITFYSCQVADFSQLYTALLTSVGGYMGGRSLAMFEAMFCAVFKGGNTPPKEG